MSWYWRWELPSVPNAQGFCARAALAAPGPAPTGSENTHVGRVVTAGACGPLPEQNVSGDLRAIPRVKRFVIYPYALFGFCGCSALPKTLRERGVHQYCAGLRAAPTNIDATGRRAGPGQFRIQRGPPHRPMSRPAVVHENRPVARGNRLRHRIRGTHNSAGAGLRCASRA